MACNYLILLVGGTPLGMYRKLIEFHKEGNLSFEYVKTFNMDEYVALPRDHKESYHTYMWSNFFKHLDIKAENVNLLDGNAKDLEKECSDYENKITAAGGINLFIGGNYILCLVDSEEYSHFVVVVVIVVVIIVVIIVVTKLLYF